MKRISAFLFAILLAVTLAACAAPAAPSQTRPDASSAPTTHTPDTLPSQLPTAAPTTVPTTTVPATTHATTPTEPDIQLSMAPEFTIYDADGNPVNLSDFRGKPVVLNFWASWCGPCKAEMPDFQTAFEEQGQDIHFIFINLTDGKRETMQSASDYISQQGYTFPVYYDLDLSAATAYEIRSIPATFFIDAEGHAIARHIGVISPQMLQQGISMIWKED